MHAAGKAIQIMLKPIPAPGRCPCQHVASTSVCHAQVYYELAAEREKQGKQKEVAIVRMEQLAPFPYDLVMREIRRYPNAEVQTRYRHPSPGTL